MMIVFNDDVYQQGFSNCNLKRFIFVALDNNGIKNSIKYLIKKLSGEDTVYGNSGNSVQALLQSTAPCSF